MGHIIEGKPTAGAAGSQPHDDGRTCRLVVAIVALGVLLGGIGGWSA